MYVLDSSAFILGYETKGPVVTIAEVFEELNGESTFRFESMKGSGMRLEIPKKETIEKIIQVSEGTGDRNVLSTTDIRLIAAAFEIGGILVTDDYAMQNVAMEIGIEIEGIDKDIIKEKRVWIFKCQSCGRENKKDEGNCPICGGEFRRKNPSR
jgi:UPF0271 protein